MCKSETLILVSFYLKGRETGTQGVGQEPSCPCWVLYAITTSEGFSGIRRGPQGGAVSVCKTLGGC